MMGLAQTEPDLLLYNAKPAPFNEPMRVFPVLDLMGGQVVRGIAGRRHEYRPVVSRLSASARPLDVARAFRDHFGLTHLYLADLDAIAGQAPALNVYARLQADGFRLWVDAGIRKAADGEVLAKVGIGGVVAGLESLAEPAALAELCQGLGPERVLLSLDLKEGRPLADLHVWEAADAVSITARAVRCGVRRLIVLDLARVGVATGTGTEDLCRMLMGAFPMLEVVAGGGVRDVADLRRLWQCGVAGALVASALHDGRLSRADLDSLA
jgi:phosphoribosylformimino-5-aminoimidazole carboxamide ribotide isomerase